MVAKPAIRPVVRSKQKSLYAIENNSIALILMMNREGISGSEWKADWGRMPESKPKMKPLNTNKTNNVTLCDGEPNTPGPVPGLVLTLVSAMRKFV